MAVKPEATWVRGAKQAIERAQGPTRGMIRSYLDYLRELDDETMALVEERKRLDEKIQANNQDYANHYEVLCWMQHETPGGQSETQDWQQDETNRLRQEEQA